MRIQTIPLKNVCIKITDGTHHSPPIVSEGVPYVTAKHIKQSGIQFFANPWFVSEESHAKIYSRCDPKLGDVLYIKDGATTGIAAINEYDFPFSMLSSVALLRPNSSICDPRFMVYWLNSPLVKEKHLSRMGGAAIKRLTLTKIKEFQIPLPPLADQKRIAAILDTADALRAKRRESLDQLDSLVQSTFLDIFGDPVANPKGWDTVSIIDTVQGKYGIKAGPFGSALKKEDYAPSGYRVYGQEQVIAGRFDIGDYYIDEQKFRKLESCAVAKGDILVSLVGSYGKVLIVPSGIEPGIINPRLLKITPRQELVTSLYLATLLQNEATQRELANKSHGGTMGILNAGLLKQLNISLPPLDLQRRFATIVESIEQQKARLRTHLEELDLLFASLQQRAFNGEL